MKQIRVERQKSYYVKIRALDILIDGTLLESIKQGETIAFEMPESGQEMLGKMDWVEALHLRLRDYAPNKTAVFEGCFSLNP